jgi:hypothetical protein
MKSEVVSPDYEITNEDLCDACRAQAYVYAQFESGELLFCLHHWQENKIKIEETALTIVNESERLLAK